MSVSSINSSITNFTNCLNTTLPLTSSTNLSPQIEELIPLPRLEEQLAQMTSDEELFREVLLHVSATQDPSKAAALLNHPALKRRFITAKTIEEELICFKHLSLILNFMLSSPGRLHEPAIHLFLVTQIIRFHIAVDLINPRSVKDHPLRTEIEKKLIELLAAALPAALKFPLRAFFGRLNQEEPSIYYHKNNSQKSIWDKELELATSVLNDLEGHRGSSQEDRDYRTVIKRSLIEFQTGRRRFMFGYGKPVSANYKEMMLYILQGLKEDRKKYYEAHPDYLPPQVFEEIENRLKREGIVYLTLKKKEGHHLFDSDYEITFEGEEKGHFTLKSEQGFLKVKPTPAFGRAEPYIQRHLSNLFGSSYAPQGEYLRFQFEWSVRKLLQIEEAIISAQSDFAIDRCWNGFETIYAKIPHLNDELTPITSIQPMDGRVPIIHLGIPESLLELGELMFHTRDGDSALSTVKSLPSTLLYHPIEIYDQWERQHKKLQSQPEEINTIQEYLQTVSLIPDPLLFLQQENELSDEQYERKYQERDDKPVPSDFISQLETYYFGISQKDFKAFFQEAFNVIIQLDHPDSRLEYRNLQTTFPALFCSPSFQPEQICVELEKFKLLIDSLKNETTEDPLVRFSEYLAQFLLQLQKKVKPSIPSLDFALIKEVRRKGHLIPLPGVNEKVEAVIKAFPQYQPNVDFMNRDESESNRRLAVLPPLHDLIGYLKSHLNNPLLTHNVQMTIAAALEKLHDWEANLVSSMINYSEKKLSSYEILIPYALSRGLIKEVPASPIALSKELEKFREEIFEGYQNLMPLLCNNHDLSQLLNVKAVSDRHQYFKHYGQAPFAYFDEFMSEVTFDSEFRPLNDWSIEDKSWCDNARKTFSLNGVPSETTALVGRIWRYKPFDYDEPAKKGDIVLIDHINEINELKLNRIQDASAIILGNGWDGIRFFSLEALELKTLGIPILFNCHTDDFKDRIDSLLVKNEVDYRYLFDQYPNIMVYLKMAERSSVKILSQEGTDDLAVISAIEELPEDDRKGALNSFYDTLFTLRTPAQIGQLPHAKEHLAQTRVRTKIGQANNLFERERCLKDIRKQFKKLIDIATEIDPPFVTHLQEEQISEERSLALMPALKQPAEWFDEVKAMMMTLSTPGLTLKEIPAPAKPTDKFVTVTEHLRAQQTERIMGIIDSVGKHHQPNYVDLREIIGRAVAFRIPHDPKIFSGTAFSAICRCKANISAVEVTQGVDSSVDRDVIPEYVEVDTSTMLLHYINCRGETTPCKMDVIKAIALLVKKLEILFSSSVEIDFVGRGNELLIRNIVLLV